MKEEWNKATQKTITSLTAPLLPSTTTPVAQPGSAPPKKPTQQQIKSVKTNSPQPVHSRQVQIRKDTESLVSPYSYDQLNQRFHRMFPMAAEIEIGVEHFILSSASNATVRDDAFDSADGLSISQVEVLQEAHLQAYHYLTEKKVPFLMLYMSVDYMC